MVFSLLVVDDDDDDFMLLASHIKHWPQQVSITHAVNGMEATQKLIAGLHPNLILVDAQMPLMNGYELVLWLMASENWRHIPVVIWTGELEHSEVSRYYLAGANSVMLKMDALQNMHAFCQYWFKLVQLPAQR